VFSFLAHFCHYVPELILIFLLNPRSEKPPSSVTGKGNPTRSTADVTARKKKVEGWTRSKFTDADLRKVGLLSPKTEAKLTDDTTIPQPEEGWRAMFTVFLLRGLSLPAHEFLHELLSCMACSYTS
jgi:hypothetical protein